MARKEELRKIHRFALQMKADFHDLALAQPGFHLLGGDMVNRFNLLLRRARELVKDKGLLEEIGEIRLEQRPIQYADFFVLLGQLASALEMELSASPD